MDTKCGDIPILLLANKVNYRLFDFDSLYSLTSVKADLSHNISEEELLKFGRALNFTDTAFTTAKDFSKLENQIRTFAELVKSLQSLTFGLTLYLSNFQVIDEGFFGDNVEREADTVVLDKITEDKIKTCSSC